MPLNHFVTLGHSGLRVSPFCLGAMTFGEDLGIGASVEVSNAILDRYIDQGGNFIDTANAYNKGHSEKILGDHLGKEHQKRDRIVLATKFSGNLFPGDPNGGGSNRKAVIAQCEESLRRLQTDYIDLYWLHNWDKYTPIEETLATLHELVQSGKVRYIGISDSPAWKAAQAQMIAQFRGWTPFIALQIEYSLFQRTVEGDLIPMAQELGMGVTPWSPLKGGLLSGKYTRENAGKVEEGRARTTASQMTDKQYDVLDALQEIAKELNSDVASVALAWVHARPGVTSTIIGARTVDHLDSNLKALDLQLTPEQTKKLDDLTQPDLNFPAVMLSTMASDLHAAGATVNGEPSKPHRITPKDWEDHY